MPPANEDSSYADLAAQNPRLDRPKSQSHPGIMAGLFLAFLLLYGLTACRGPQWQDSGHHIVRILTGTLDNHLGLALTHPLHYWLGRLALRIDLFEPALAITLISSLFGAITVACLFGCVCTLTGSTPAGLFAAASLGLAHTFWREATQTEMFTLVTALLTIECWSIVLWYRSRRIPYLLAAALANGLGVSNHLLALLTTPIVLAVALVALWRRRISPGILIGGILLWLIGAAPYALMVVEQGFRTGHWAETLQSALFGHQYSREVLNLIPSAGMLAIVGAFTMLSFPNLLLPLSFLGIARGRTEIGSASFAVLLAGLGIHALFAFRYSVPDQYLFMIPTYLYLAVFGGVGFAWFEHGSTAHGRRRLYVASAVLLALTPAIYLPAPAVARRLDVLDGLERHRPYRSDYRYLFWPWSVADTSAERMSRHAVTLAGPGGLIIVGDAMSAWAIRYGAIEYADDSPTVLASKLSDLDPDRVLAALHEGRRVVFVPGDTKKVPKAPPVGTWEREGDLYVLRSDR
ncbi:MAG: DUF2723 domain-containing protein [Phycisphaerae bacterium]|nr:DUF2723 domain-containing protein [Phycisphaerae bacterium]